MIACGGRKPQLIDKKSDRDDKMDCMMIYAEISKCTTCIIEKYHNGKKAMSNTVGAAVVGYVIFPPALFFMDLKQADYKEMGACMERREHLISLGKTESCDWCKNVVTDEKLMAIAEEEHKMRMEEEKKEAEEEESR